MDPAGAGRLRGFRAPGADAAVPNESGAAVGQPEVLESARPPAERVQGLLRRSTGWGWAVA
ncbi:MAG TPA: hypothetical protein VLJ88_13945, partial [Propionibacteriaceae bacterium]|nr:hypothetical protein [Propionibacteriaceae bacterium]